MDTQQETCIVESAWKAFENCFSTYAPHSRELLRRAFDFAHDKHRGQTRKSGEPYILHPLAVAHILAELHMDVVSLISALLHDVVEDTSVSLEEIATEFNEEIAGIVDGLTKLEKVKFRSSQEKLAENFRKMVLAMSKDIRVIIVKVADRTHNMRTIKGHKLEKQQKIAQETLEIYAPLAGRLGIYRLKAELEDLCLKALKPSVYFSLVTRIDQKKAEREEIIQTFCQGLEQKLDEIKIPAEVVGRIKHFFSIYKKMSEKQIDFEDIYDLFAVRVMVDTISQCYEVLGVVHSHFRPVPGRFKDYIAMPKPNLYQSLHTTVINENGELLEVQIRTKRMHDIAENGIAAHWAYKEARKEEGLSTKTQDFQKFNWLKQIVNHQQELNDPEEFLEAVKVDLFDDEVYVFTPKGDVLELRRGATALDYAFSVHTDLGLRTQGAKINGRIVPIRTEIQSGDMIEILTTNKNRANKDWLSFVRTSKARSKIRAYLRSEDRENAKKAGVTLLDRALESENTNVEKLKKAGAFENISQLFSLGSLDDLLIQVGYGKLTPEKVMNKLFGAKEALTDAEVMASIEAAEGSTLKRTGKRTPKQKIRGRLEESVLVQGLEGIVVRLAKCCQPLPGQPIIGFVSRGRGVTVHHGECQWALSMDPARRVECQWESDVQASHKVKLRITTKDQHGLLADITKIVSNMGLNISGADIQTTADRRGLIILKLDVSDIAQLKDIHQRIEAVKGVLGVERVFG